MNIDSEPTKDEIAEEKNPYLSLRERAISDLGAVANSLRDAQYQEDQAIGEPASQMPDNLVRDPLTNATISHRAMIGADRLYDFAKGRFGRELTYQEEEQILVVLDYILKRFIVIDLNKKKTQEPARGKHSFAAGIATGMGVLPDEDIFHSHDLAHILLAIKQGLFNDNSVIPEFMQSENAYNTGIQAMLEEAFASIFTINEEGNNYDSHMRDLNPFHSEAEGYFDPKKTKLFRGLFLGKDPVFKEPEYAGRARLIINGFILRNTDKLKQKDPLVDLALYTQGASLSAGIDSPSVAVMTEEKKIEFLEHCIADAQTNIDVLISGIVPQDASKKYQATVELTRATLTNSLDKAKSDPGHTIFLEELLSAFGKLYPKAKAQQDATFLKMRSQKYDVPSN